MEDIENKIKVDAEALSKDIQERAEKDGLVIKVFCPPITPEHILTRDTESMMPVVTVKGWATELTAASAVNSLQSTIDSLMKRDGVKEAVWFLKSISTTSTISVEGEAEDKND